MSTQVLTVPLGTSVRVLSGDNQSFCAQPGATGTMLLEYAADGVNFTTFTTTGTGLAASLAARSLNLGQFGVIRATAQTVAGVLLACDVGQDGFYDTGVVAPGQAVLACASVPMSTPNATTEGNVFALRLPAGLLRANFSIEIDAMFTATNNANVKTIKAYFGNTGLGTAVATQVLTSASGGRMSVRIGGKNDGASVIASSIGSALGFGISTTANVTVSSNCAYQTAEQELYITSTKATGTDAVSLDSIIVKLFQ